MPIYVLMVYALVNKSLNNKVFIISCIYISPAYDIMLFNDFLYTFVNSISNNNDTFIFLYGDFNIYILNKNKLLLILLIYFTNLVFSNYK